MPSTPPSRCFLRMFLKNDCWPVGLPHLSPFSLLVLPGGKQAPLVIWLHQQAAGSSHSSSFASGSLPFHLYLA
jgi:hypothetical protein